MTPIPVLKSLHHSSKRRKKREKKKEKNDGWKLISPSDKARWDATGWGFDVRAEGACRTFYFFQAQT